MMIATGLAAMHASFSAPAETNAPYRGTRSREASGYGSLTMSAQRSADSAGSAMAKGSPAKTRVAVPPMRARAPAGRLLRDDTEPRAALHARNIPSELAVLLGEVHRLQSELAAAPAQGTELAAAAAHHAGTRDF